MSDLGTLLPCSTRHPASWAGIVAAVAALTWGCSGEGMEVSPPPSRMVFATQPAGGSGGTPFNTQPAVEVLDASGNRVEGTSVSVSIGLGANPASGRLSGTTTLSTSNGLAVFTDLRIDKAGATYTLTASAAGLDDVTSASFDVTVGPAVAESSVVSVERNLPVPDDTVTLTLRARDAGGNNVASGGLAVVFAASGGTSQGTVGPSADHDNGTYTAEFVADGAGTPLTIGATVDGSVVTAGLPTITVVQFKSMITSTHASPGFSCGILQGEAAYCWGDGLFGTLGHGAFESTIQPQEVAGGFAWSVTAGGARHVCGLTTTGMAYCWGSGDGGALGNGSSGQGSADNRNSPVPVTTSLTWSYLTGAHDASCAIDQDSAAYCWGINTWGRLGDGSQSLADVPRLVTGGLAWGSIGIGIGYGCGLSSDGSAYCWGSGPPVSGASDDCGLVSCALSPRQVPGGVTFRSGSITVGGNHACALTTDGLAQCWGANSSGQLGDATHSSSSTPVAVAGALTFTQVDAGDLHTCGVTEGGNAYCWGGNDSGQLGTGTHTGANSPQMVLGGHEFTQVSTGQSHTCGVTTRGAALCWGQNNEGQLGDGAPISSRPVPVRVRLP